MGGKKKYTEMFGSFKEPFNYFFCVILLHCRVTAAVMIWPVFHQLLFIMASALVHYWK